MPTRAPRICGCGKSVPWGVLCKCQIEALRSRNARADANRLPSRLRGYDSKWRREREVFLALAANKNCACGCGRLADMVDHIIPHRGDWKLFWNRKNWQPMASSPCHSSRKQSRESRDDNSNV